MVITKKFEIARVEEKMIRINETIKTMIDYIHEGNFTMPEAKNVSKKIFAVLLSS